MNIKLKLLCLFLPVFASGASLRLGKVKGTRETLGDKVVNRYLGIPYAQPPVGDLRFKAPRPVEKPWDGIVEATQWPKSCQQSGATLSLLGLLNPEISEDCLYLNIWSPEREEGQPLKPVLFWIYGGSYIMGSSTQSVYNALPLAALGDVVVVTINYRSGAFGFFSGGTPDMPGNQALLDQIMALEWVGKNIVNFGGDAEQITLFGESAGGISVGFHVLSPVSQRLFKRAVIMSGSPLNPLIVESKEKGLKKASNLIHLVGCSDGLNSTLPSEEEIRCIQRLDPKVILDQQASPQLTEGVTGIFTSMAFIPVFGTDLMPESPETIVRKKQYKSDTSIMVGIVNDEGSVVEQSMPKNPQVNGSLVNGSKEQWKENMKSFLNLMPNGVGKNGRIISDYYFDSVEDDPKILMHTFAKAATDYYLACPALVLGEKLVDGNDVYSYFVTYKSKSRASKVGFNSFCNEDNGVCHALEVQFLFGSPLLQPSKFNDDDKEMSREMIDIWSTFAKTGRTKWSKYYAMSNDLVVPVQYEINPLKEVRINNDYKYLACKLWQPFIA